MRRLLLLAAALAQVASPALAYPGGSYSSGGGSATVTSADVEAAAKSLMGVPNGFAGLDGSGFLPTANLPTVPVAKLPIGTTLGTVLAGNDSGLATAESKAGSALQPTSDLAPQPITIAGTLYARLDTFLQNTALYALQASSSAHPGLVADLFGGIGRTLAAMASDTWNMANHGALGDATTDDAAFSAGVAYAALHPGLRLVWPSSLGLTAGTLPGVWDLIAPPGASDNATQGFILSAHTTLAGMDKFQAVLHYVNDYGATGAHTTLNGYQNLITSNGGSDITIENLTIEGNWNPANTSLPASGYGEGNAIFLYGGTDVTIRNIVTENQFYFGMTARGIIGLREENNLVRNTGTDGINDDDSAQINIIDNVIEHTADDCMSAHSDTADQMGVRRIINVVGNLCFNTNSIRILAARNTNISGNEGDTVSQAFINLESVTPSGGSGVQEGPSATSIVNIVGNSAQNLLNRQNVDGLTGGVDFITIAGYSAQKGVGGAIPGENDSTSTDATYGTVIDPYAAFMGNSTSTTVPIGGSTTINITGNVAGRLLPASNTTAYPTWSAFKQGLIASKYGDKNPSLNESDIRATCFDLQGGNGSTILIDGNICQGQAAGVQVEGSGHWKDVTVSNNEFVDFSSYALFVYTTARLDLRFVNNFIDGDPYLKSANRKVVTAGTNAAAHDGTWANNGGPVGVYNPSGSGVEFGWNVLENVSVDIAGLSGDAIPATGWYVHDNLCRANNVTTLNAFSTTSQGMGEIHSISCTWEPWDSNPQDAAFDTMLTAPLKAGFVQPASGSWQQGDWVANASPSASNPYTGWLRSTTGTTDTAADWIAMPLYPLYAGNLGTTLAADGFTINQTVTGVLFPTGGDYYNSGGTSTTPLSMVFSPAPSGGTTAVGHISQLKVLGFNAPTTPGSGYVVGTAYQVTDTVGDVLATITPTAAGALTTYTAVYNTSLSVNNVIPAAPYTVAQPAGGTSAIISFANFGILAGAMDNQGLYPGAAPTVAVTPGNAGSSPTETVQASAAAALAGNFAIAGSETATGFVDGSVAPSVTAAAITTASTTSTAAVGPTALTAQQDVITSCPVGDAVALPVATGHTVTVRNETSNACLVEPPSGANFGVNGAAGTTNAAAYVPAFGQITVLEATATQDWLLGTQDDPAVVVTASETLTSAVCHTVQVDEAASAITLTAPATLPPNCKFSVFQASPAADTATLAFGSGTSGVYGGTANVTAGQGYGFTAKVLSSSAIGVITGGLQ